MRIVDFPSLYVLVDGHRSILKLQMRYRLRALGEEKLLVIQSVSQSLEQKLEHHHKPLQSGFLALYVSVYSHSPQEI